MEGGSSGRGEQDLAGPGAAGCGGAGALERGSGSGADGVAAQVEDL